MVHTARRALILSVVGRDDGEPEADPHSEAAVGDTDPANLLRRFGWHDLEGEIRILSERDVWALSRATHHATLIVTTTLCSVILADQGRTSPGVASAAEGLLGSLGRLARYLESGHAQDGD